LRLAPGGGTELGPGTVTVTADPSLLAADPGAMAAAASSFRSAAYQANTATNVTANAAGRLVPMWKGSGALAFLGATNDVK
jgi:uncharacterized protein YukE